jgi:hypothetical protein
MNRLIFILLLFPSIINAQDSISENKSYPFILQDSPARLFSMRQFDEDYLSTHRLIHPLLNKGFNSNYTYLAEIAAHILVFGTMTHEEAHRSVLVSLNIGSITQPFILSRRGGYVAGVQDVTLRNLRDNDLPDFIRLHTSGLESDYMLLHREKTMLAFNIESYRNIIVEFAFRNLTFLEYYMFVFVHYDIDGAEEKNELKRDVVGNDIYGAARHLHRPAMTYKRYTMYKELTSEEKNYLQKMGYRTLLNLVNPNIIGIRNLKLSNTLKMNFGLGHTLCPFGDFIDEDLWFLYNNKLRINLYVRQFENKNHWFPAAGLSIQDFPIRKNIEISGTLHYWNQPNNLLFSEVNGFKGGAIDLLGKYFFNTKIKSGLKKISLDLGIILKTKGFLPEETIMRKHFGLRFGTTFFIDRS